MKSLCQEELSGVFSFCGGARISSPDSGGGRRRRHFPGVFPAATRVLCRNGGHECVCAVKGFQSAPSEGQRRPGISPPASDGGSGAATVIITV